jgi:drug/metabolite transporter (DMT)-like permease
MLAKFLSRKFLLALVVAVVGIVRMFVDVDDALVGQITNIVLTLGALVAYVIANVVQKKVAP